MPVEDLTRQWLADRTNFFFKATANAGISWGTDNMPAGSLGWFAGPRSGGTAALSAGSFQSGDTDASQAVAAIVGFANQFGGIRRTRIVIYRTHWQVGQTVAYDGTAISNSIYKVGDFASGAPKPGIGSGVVMAQSTIDTTINYLINAYNAACRNTTLTLTNTVCHTSCHSNCHCARGRR